MTPSLTANATGASSQTSGHARVRRAGQATRRTVGILAGVVALAGVEHGVGEMLQGSSAPEGIMILSWPNADAFRLLGGEPAMTVVPDLFITGILAIVTSVIFFGWAALFAQSRQGALVLMALSVAMLLVGGGIAPPLIGLALGLTATAVRTPGKWWRTHGGRTIARAWPWLLSIDAIAFLGLFPGVVIVAGTLGSGAVPEAAAYALMAAAIAFLPLSLVAALAADS